MSSRSGNSASIASAPSVGNRTSSSTEGKRKGHTTASEHPALGLDLILSELSSTKALGAQVAWSCSSQIPLKAKCHLLDFLAERRCANFCRALTSALDTQLRPESLQLGSTLRDRVVAARSVQVRQNIYYDLPRRYCSYSPWRKKRQKPAGADSWRFWGTDTELRRDNPATQRAAGEGGVCGPWARVCVYGGPACGAGQARDEDGRRLVDIIGHVLRGLNLVGQRSTTCAFHPPSRANRFPGMFQDLYTFKTVRGPNLNAIGTHPPTPERIALKEMRSREGAMLLPVTTTITRSALCLEANKKAPLSAYITKTGCGPSTQHVHGYTPNLPSRLKPSGDSCGNWPEFAVEQRWGCISELLVSRFTTSALSRDDPLFSAMFSTLDEPVVTLETA
ncbi:hypothetical protein B0H17DRAFT_1144145 [Mycena rosella]|uniref:Uncharacterized protein n=1 Tax=Mycena rosella TaxID=1033263 RepID=A0AAD7G613_MYCRO|nr:hypothetical protein B0H17DRAFT_1144145 [Mycena rosella]